MNRINKHLQSTLFFLLMVIVSCDNNDDNSIFSLSVSVDDVTYNGAVVSWTSSTRPNNEAVVYKVLLNNNIVAESFRGSEYVFNNLTENTEYSGTIFALSENGEETFKDFSFSTLRNSNLLKHITITTQSQIDNFYYTGVLNLIIDGENINSLSGLSTLKQLHNAITIKNTSLETLDGLENLEYAGPHTHLPLIRIENNKNLKDISALSKISKAAKLINLKDNIVLENLQGLEPTNGELGQLYIDNSPITNLSVFSDLKELKWLNILNTNIVNFDGLNGLTKIIQLSIQHNSNLESLSGLGNLTDSNNNFDFGVMIYLKDNQKLTDFCGIRNLMTNTTIWDEFINDSLSIYHFEIEGNAYNPNENDLRTDLCRL